MRRWRRSQKTLSSSLAERLASEQAAVGTLNAMIKGAMAAQDDSATRMAAAWMN